MTNMCMLLAKIQMYISSLCCDLIVCQRDLVKRLRAVPQIGLQRRKASATSTKRCKFCNSNSEFPCLCCLLYWSSDPTNEPQRRQKKQLSQFHRVPSNIPKTLFESDSTPGKPSVAYSNSVQILFIHASTFPVTRHPYRELSQTLDDASHALIRKAVSQVPKCPKFTH